MLHFVIYGIALGIFLIAGCGKSKNCIDYENVNVNKVCSTIYDPVCGCDDRTYQNECRAEANGVVLWSKGPCIR
ncbi:MAG: Kazal-type serine protease inhibitor [Chitinophagales bacterium]